MPPRLRPLLAACLLAAAVRAAEPPTAQGLPDTIARIRGAVAAVGTYNPANRPPMVFSASGFFIDDRGYFLTANHVLTAIEGRRRLRDLRVFLHTLDDRTGIPATVVARAAKYDLALLKVKGDAYPAMSLGDSTSVREGQPIALMGFPFGFLLGLHPSTSSGIISNVSPIAIPAVNAALLDPATIEALRSPFNIFQLDATAYPGNSGGPLFDPRTGQALGVVNSAFIRRTKEKVLASGISYAIPIHFAKKLLDEALKAKPGQPTPKPELTPPKP